MSSNNSDTKVKDLLSIDVEGVNFDFSMEMNKRGGRPEELASSPIYLSFAMAGKSSISSKLIILDPARVEVLTRRLKPITNFRITVSEMEKEK